MMCTLLSVIVRGVLFIFVNSMLFDVYVLIKNIQFIVKIVQTKIKL
ncbi:hypothetical protein Q7M_1161 (plasmid) [Borrelia crocidurae str. Achema]|uniref:Uncharacterized protein n=1 Tax=Borrelia crocidurae (strain Achema) TaxID=1155096 RepID=I0FFA3_BORCA|nr:hypothetical protein Q7M_1161 [Borrelia crocidurae str. Achema]